MEKRQHATRTAKPVIRAHVCMPRDLAGIGSGHRRAVCSVEAKLQSRTVASRVECKTAALKDMSIAADCLDVNKLFQSVRNRSSRRREPRWRNGRRSGLKIHRAQAHAGSSPALGTNFSRQ